MQRRGRPHSTRAKIQPDYEHTSGHSLLVTDTSSFRLLLTEDRTAVAFARWVEDRELPYMVIECCPLCGKRHTHSAERLYGPDHRRLGFAPSYTKRRAVCDLNARLDWQRLHPEVRELDDWYHMLPFPAEAPADDSQ